MTESTLLSDILLRFGSDPRLRVWRSNVLVAKDKSGRVIRAGVKGQADISGILMGGRRIEIEVKSKTGQQRPEQKKWQAMIERFGGVYVLARSTDDVERAITT